MNFDEQFDAQVSPVEHAFPITRKAKRQRITPESHPEILEMSGVFDSDVPKTVVATHFFNRQNENEPYKYVSPWDAEYVRKLVQRTPISNFDMNSFQGWTRCATLSRV